MTRCSPCTKAGSWAKWKGLTEPRRATQACDLREHLGVHHRAEAQRPVSGLRNSHEIF